MAEKAKERLQHALLALLLSAGLVMTLCGTLDETLLSPLPLMVAAGVILIFEISALNKITAWGGKGSGQLCRLPGIPYRC